MAKSHLSHERTQPIPSVGHLTGLQEQTKQLLLEIQAFVNSLGENIIEDVRPRRIFYSKSLTFRTFLDIQPRNNCILISTRSKAGPAIIYTVRTKKELDDINARISRAYEAIR